MLVSAFLSIGSADHIKDNAKLLETGEKETFRLTESQLQVFDRLDGRVDDHHNCALWAAAGTLDSSVFVLLVHKSSQSPRAVWRR